MKKLNSLVLLTLGIVILDQVAKYLIRSSMLPGTSIPVVPGIFSITYVMNSGASFGLLKGFNLIFILVSIAVLVYLYGFFKHRDKYFLQVCIIAGGVIGNLLDRLTLGFVVDFLHFFSFPIFNIADSAISIGVFWLILISWNQKEN